MQGIGGGSVTIGGAIMLYLSTSPLLVWLAIIIVFMGVIFMVHIWVKRHLEAREAQGLLPIGQRIKT